MTASKDDIVKLFRLSSLTDVRTNGWAFAVTHRVHFWTILYVVASLQALNFLIEILILATSDEECKSLDVRSPEGSFMSDSDCSEKRRLIRRFSYFFDLAIVTILTCQLLRKIRRIFGHQARHFPRFLTRFFSGSELKTTATAWVAAGSLDLYTETVSSITRTGKVSGAFVLLFAVACTVARVLALVPMIIKSENSHYALDEFCGRSKICTFSQLFGPVFTYWGNYMVLIVYLQVNIFRSCTWSATMELAARKEGDFRVKIFMWLPASCLVMFLVGVSVTVCTNVMIPNGPVEKPEQMISLLAVQMLYAIGGSLLIFFARIPSDIGTCLASKVTNTVRTIWQWLFGKDNGEESYSKCEVSFFSYLEDDLGNMPEILLFANVVFWIEHLTVGAPFALMVTAFVFRVAGLALIMCSRQRKCGFEDIRDSPCFGLLVEARTLRRILQAYMNGDPQPLKAGVVMHKGTLHRMANTLALSYRWQDEEAEIAPGLSLNMNKYQIQAVLEALKSLRKRYVWLDRLSVPQDDDEPLKFTLLARMMAVYSAADVTLAIRTAEKSGSKYHERAWTCQEFVMARKLVVATQKPELGNGKTAMSAEFDKRMKTLRTRTQMETFKPLWLRSNARKSAFGKVTEISRADGEYILKQFHSLANLKCKYPEDRLRALLPLVACTPLEDHQELVSLVLALSSATDNDLLDWKTALLKQHKEQRTLQRGMIEGNGTPHNLNVTVTPWWSNESQESFPDMSTPARKRSVSGDDSSILWMPESTFAARVMGNVSCEAVLETCNDMRKMQRSVTVSEAKSVSEGLQNLPSLPHKKKYRRAPRRDSTVSGVSCSPSEPGRGRNSSFISSPLPCRSSLNESGNADIDKNFTSFSPRRAMSGKQCSMSDSTLPEVLTAQQQQLDFPPCLFPALNEVHDNSLQTQLLHRSGNSFTEDKEAGCGSSVDSRLHSDYAEMDIKTQSAEEQTGQRLLPLSTKNLRLLDATQDGELGPDRLSFQCGGAHVMKAWEKEESSQLTGNGTIPTVSSSFSKFLADAVTQSLQSIEQAFRPGKPTDNDIECGGGSCPSYSLVE